MMYDLFGCKAYDAIVFCFGWLVCLEACELFLWVLTHASRIEVAIVYAGHSCVTRRYDDVVCNIYDYH